VGLLCEKAAAFGATIKDTPYYYTTAFTVFQLISKKFLSLSYYSPAASSKLRVLLIFPFNPGFKGGPGSSVGIATGYGLDGSRIESGWGPDFPHLSRPALGPTQPPVQWVPGLSRG
jgi:hypothetical protein